MGGFSDFIEQKLMPIAAKVGENRVLTIIRNSMCVYIALLILGSISILLTNFPVEAVANFLAPAAPLFNTIFNCTTGVMGLYAAASVAYYAALEYKADVFASVLTGSLLQGDSLAIALDRAVQFVTLGIRATFGQGLPNREGILLERILDTLRAPLGSYMCRLVD